MINLQIGGTILSYQNASPQEFLISGLDSKSTIHSVDKNVNVFYNVLNIILHESRKFVKTNYFHTIDILYDYNKALVTKIFIKYRYFFLRY